MPSLDPVSLDWMERAQQRNKPYGFREIAQIPVLSIVRDHTYVIQEWVGQTGHVCWRAINPSTLRPRKIHLEARLRSGKAVWAQQPNVQDETFVIDETLPRSERTDLYLGWRDWSAQFHALQPGEESAITTSPRCRTQLESAFTIHPSRWREAGTDPSHAEQDSASSSPTNSSTMQSRGSGTEMNPRDTKPTVRQLSALDAAQLQELEKNILEDRKRAQEYRDMLRDELEPSRKAQYRRRIEELEESATKYNQQYEELRKNLRAEAGTEVAAQLDEVGEQLRTMNETLREVVTGQETIRSDIGNLLGLMETEFDENERNIITAMATRLDPTQQANTAMLLKALRDNRLSQEELNETLATIQQAVTELQQGQSTIAGHELVADIGRSAEIIEDPKLSIEHKLKVTVPIIPVLLSYEAELYSQSGINLQAVWEQLLTKVHRRALSS